MFTTITSFFKQHPIIFASTIIAISAWSIPVAIFVVAVTGILDEF